MATVRELQASFIAKVGGMKSAIQGLKKDVGGLQKTTETANKKMTSNWTKTGDAMINHGKKVSAAGDKVTGFGKKWTKVTSIVGAAAVGLGGTLFALTNKITKGADEIVKHSQQMGVSAKFYQEMDYWANQNGLSQAQMEKAVGRLNQRIGKAAAGNKKYTEALEALGINMDDVRNGTLSTEDAFAQSIQTLSEMDNEQEKVAKATELFGTRMARQLLPALQDGSLSMDEARKKAHELGLVMSDEQLKAAEKFQRSWENVKSSLSLFGESIAVEVLPYMQKMLDYAQDKLPEFQQRFSKAVGTAASSIKDAVNWFKSLDPQLKKSVGLFAGVAAAIGPVSIALGALMKIYGPFAGIVGKAMRAVGKFGGLLPMVRSGLVALTGPVGLTVAAIAALAAGFITAYKKSETFRNAVQKGWQAIKDTAVRVFDFLKPYVMQAISAITGFFSEKIGQMKTFWDQNGQQILQAFKNVFNGIWAVVKPVINGILSIIKTTFPIVLQIVKSVWGNIKGVIDGALKVIMGLIQTFSGLFTGDIKKMWTGIKNIFVGALKFIWNYVQLIFLGKMLKGIGSLVKSMVGLFKSLWTKSKDIFVRFIKSIYNYVQRRFTAMKNFFSKTFTAIKNFFSKIWSGIKGVFTSVINAIVAFVKRRFDVMKSNIQAVFNAIKKVATSIWNGIKRAIINPVKSAVSTAQRSFTSFKNKVSSIFSSIKNGISNKVTDMINTVKNMPGKMKDGLVKGKNALKKGALSLGRGMVSGIADAVNGVIGGVNWVLKKLKAPTLGTWKPANSLSWYAKGTGGHPQDGPAVVGDGTGSNKGSELVTTPDGKSYMSPDKPTLIPNMPKGTQVLSAKMTSALMNSSLPQYADGIWGSIKSGASKVGSGIKKGAVATKDFTVNTGKAVGRGVKTGAKKVAEWSGNVWDYMKNPSKLLNIALKKVGSFMPSGSDATMRIAKGAFKTIKDKAIDYIKDKFTSFGGSNPSGKGVERWRNTVIRALGMNGLSTSKAMQDRILRQISTESGGNPRAVQGAGVWDINMAQGNPARGLMQTIPQTFNAYKFKGHGNIYNGLDNLLAALNYAKNRYGSSLSFLGQGHGYKNGGFGIDRKQLAWIADGGWAESIISHDPAKHESQKAIWERTGDALGFRDNQYNKEVLNELKRIASAIEQDRETVIEMDDKAVGKAVEKHVTTKQGRKYKTKKKSW